MENVSPQPIDPAHRRRLNYELLVVLVALWLPMMLTGLESYFGPQFYGLWTGPFYLAYELCLHGSRPLILLLLVYLSARKFSDFGLVKPSLAAVVVGVGVAVVMKLSAGFYMEGARNWGWLSHHRTISSDLGSGFGRWAYMICSVLSEEMLYRSYLQTRLRELNWQPAWIILFTSFLFMAPHIYQGFAPLPILFVHGLLLGYVFYQSKSIWTSIVAHFLYNGLILGLPGFLAWMHSR